MPMKPVMLIGTSAPHRREMATRALANEYELIFLAPDIDERQLRAADATALTRKIAEAKMTAVLAQVAHDDALTARLHNAPRGSVAVTFDQVVVWRDEVREKPTSPAECRHFIASYANSAVSTVQATVLYSFDTHWQGCRHNVTTTTFADVTPAMIDRVIARGVCQHAAGALVVEDVDMKAQRISIDPGCEDEVRGFCVRTVRELLAEMPLPVMPPDYKRVT